MPFALDHLSVGDAAPWRLVELAAAGGASGCCLFLQSMSVLPRLPDYCLVTDKAARDRTRDALLDNKMSLDLVYPFTLSGRSDVGQFEGALGAASELEAQAVNLLVYDRDASRRIDQVGSLSERAATLGMKSVVEFFPQSTVPNLATAVDLVRAVGTRGLGVNVDVLHYYRSGYRTFEALASAGDVIGYAQLADGPLEAPENTAVEAAFQRHLPGQGAFDLAAFLKALPSGVKVSVEAPDEAAIASGQSDQQRMQAVMRAVRVYELSYGSGRCWGDTSDA